jgi:hypothetical protein
LTKIKGRANQAAQLAQNVLGIVSDGFRQTKVLSFPGNYWL